MNTMSPVPQPASPAINSGRSNATACPSRFSRRALSQHCNKVVTSKVVTNKVVSPAELPSTQGLDLSGLFYQEAVRLILAKRFPFSIALGRRLTSQPEGDLVHVSVALRHAT